VDNCAVEDDPFHLPKRKLWEEMGADPPRPPWRPLREYRERQWRETRLFFLVVILLPPLLWLMVRG
jgi:hypothetical protein